MTDSTSGDTSNTATTTPCTAGSVCVGVGYGDTTRSSKIPKPPRNSSIGAVATTTLSRALVSNPT